MDQKSPIEIARKYAEELKNVVPLKMVILYGSFVSGNPRAESDIDIAVVVEDIKQDYLELSSLLWKIGWNVDIRIEPILMDEKQDSDFIKDIKEHGIVAYEKRVA